MRELKVGGKKKNQWQVLHSWKASNSISHLTYHFISIFPKCNMGTFHNKRSSNWPILWLAFFDFFFFSKECIRRSFTNCKNKRKHWTTCRCWAEFSESVLKPREFIWLSGEYRGRSLILKQIPKLLEQMVRVSRRKTLNRNHVPLGLVVSSWTTSSKKSCQSPVLISAKRMGKRKTVPKYHLLGCLNEDPGSSRSPGESAVVWKLRDGILDSIQGDLMKIHHFSLWASPCGKGSKLKPFWGTETTQGGNET